MTLMLLMVPRKGRDSRNNMPYMWALSSPLLYLFSGKDMIMPRKLQYSMYLLTDL